MMMSAGTEPGRGFTWESEVPEIEGTVDESDWVAVMSTKKTPV